MILGSPGSEQHRFRVGWFVLACGIALIGYAWGSWLYRALTPEEPGTIVREFAGGPASGLAGSDAGDRVGDRTLERGIALQGLRLWLVVALVSVLAFLFGSYAILRASRRYRAATDRQRASPTAADDLWSAHRVPDDFDAGR